MSDFSDLCPLFNTGMYSELTLPYFTLTARSTTNQFEGGFPFGRSVIVTAAYVKKHTTPTSTTAAITVKLAKAATWAATQTVFASKKLSKTTTTQVVGRYLTMTVTAKTFGATDVLHVVSGSKETIGEHVSILVRYKEK